MLPTNAAKVFACAPIFLLINTKFWRPKTAVGQAMFEELMKYAANAKAGDFDDGFARWARRTGDVSASSERKISEAGEIDELLASAARFYAGRARASGEWTTA